MPAKTVAENNLARVRQLALDLRRQPPRSPRETLGGYVLAARAVDKCRADLAGQIGEYHTNCPLDQIWLKFARIDYDAFRALLASGATDPDMDAWIREHAKKRREIAVIRWNNKQRDLSLSDLPAGLQEYLEDYIPKFVPRGRVVYRFFDVYDLEEGRL